MEKNTIRKVVVNPVPRSSAQGRDKQIFTVIGKNRELIPTKSMGVSKDLEVPTYLMFEPNYETNKLITGLDEMVVNPFKGKDVSTLQQEFGLPSQWMSLLDNIVSQDKINLQTYYEILDGVDPDYYTSKITGTMFTHRGDIRNLPEPTFLEKFKVIFYEKPNVFEDDGTVKTSRSRLAIQLIKNNNKIAEKRSAVNGSLHFYYISEENEAEKALNKKRDVIKQAYKLLADLQDKHTDYTQYKVASILYLPNGNTLLKDKVASDKIKAVLDDYVMTDGSGQMSNIDKFLTVVGLLNTKDGLIKFDIQYLVQQALNKSVISVRDGNYIWHSKSDSPNVYKFNSYDKLINFLILEFKIFNPKDKSVTNWYKELLDEVKIKDVWVE
jgi:hypothetical protein